MQRLDISMILTFNEFNEGGEDSWYFTSIFKKEYPREPGKVIKKIMKYWNPKFDKLGEGPQTSEYNSSNGVWLKCSTGGRCKWLDLPKRQKLHCCLLQLFEKERCWLARICHVVLSYGWPNQACHSDKDGFSKR